MYYQQSYCNDCHMAMGNCGTCERDEPDIMYLLNQIVKRLESLERRR